MPLDRMLYLVVSLHDGQHWHGKLVHETELDRMNRGAVIADILSGQYGAIAHVIEFNPVEGICREVTDDEDFRKAIARDPDDH
jgi:hypothetical protein